MRLDADHAFPSPCIKVCALDGATGWCVGCGRTIEEIATWGGLAVADKSEVLKELPMRLSAVRSRSAEVN